MTKEEYLKKLKVNKEEQERKLEEAFRRKQEKYTKKIIENIVHLIENVDAKQEYELSRDETWILCDGALLKKRLDELRKKYDFLEFHIQNGLVYSNDIISIFWNVKGE